MLVELTPEQIVTRLLSSEEIITPKKEKQYISNVVHNLGGYLEDLPIQDEIVNETSVNTSRYTFIK